MTHAKALIDIDGDILPVYFKKATSREIYDWVLNNFDNLELDEALSCSATLKDDQIKIVGDQDNRTFLITSASLIDLDKGVSICGCTKKEKDNCNNQFCNN